jgi:capsid protein
VDLHRFRLDLQQFRLADLPARDFDRDPAAYLGCEWLPPKFDHVDPKKDVEAEILAVNAGLRSRRQAISERG